MSEIDEMLKNNEKVILNTLKKIRNSLYVEENFYEWQVAIDKILDLYNKEKEKNKSLEQENSFLKMMYRGTDEFKAIEKQSKEIAELKQDIKEVMKKDRDCLTFGYRSAYVGLIDDLINIIKEDIKE